MNNNIVEIKISGLPAIFPSTEYVGKLNTFLRVISIGTHSDKFITDTPFRTIYDNNYMERPIQSLTYNKYKIRIMANEYLRADRIEFAKYGYVVTQDNVTHKMKVLNVSLENVGDTELGIYVIEYADINPVNYKNQKHPINNYLEHDQIQEEFTTAQLELLEYSYQPEVGSAFNYQFYTELLFEYDVAAPKEEKEEVSGIERVTRSDISGLKKARFYLTTADKNLLAPTLPTSATVKLIGSSGSHTALERIIPEIQPVGIDLWQIDITMKYHIRNLYPENTL